MKLWSWQKENLPSIAHSIRTAIAATAAVIAARLVQMPEAYWAAIATLVVMQSSLGYADALYRTHHRDGPRRVGRSARGALLWSESSRIPSRDRSHRLALLWLSSGEDRLSLCQRYAGDHRFDSAFKSGVDYRPPSIH